MIFVNYLVHRLDNMSIHKDQTHSHCECIPLRKNES